MSLIRAPKTTIKDFLDFFSNRRNLERLPDDYPYESAGLEVVPHLVPARHFFLLPAKALGVLLGQHLPPG
jgi:hypothetical protein